MKLSFWMVIEHHSIMNYGLVGPTSSFIPPASAFDIIE